MNYCYQKYSHLVLWGSETLDSQRAFLALSNYYEIDSFLISKEDPQKPAWNDLVYYNVDFYFRNRRNRSEKIIITLRKSEPWKQYVDYLIAKGLKFFDDFNLYFLLDDDVIDLGIISQIVTDREECLAVIKKFAGERKLFFINGNCQTGLLQKYLIANKSFNSQYVCIDLPRICLVNSVVENLYEIALACADLCISQDVSINNRFSKKLSTQYIREHLQNGAVLIVIPKLHFQGYFPQFKSVQENAVVLGRLPVFAYGDKYIDDLLKRGQCYRCIVKIVLDPDYLPAEYVNKFFDEQLAKYLAEEASCDVKMYDYIYNNCRKEVLWHSFNHPTNKVIKELAVRTLLKIGIDKKAADKFTDIDVLDGSEGLRGQMQLIYPSVYKALGIAPDDKRYVINNNSSTFKVDDEDYVRLYCNSYNRTPPVIDIWGSCVSRELFNFTSNFKVNAYILQNPVHTYWRDPVNIAESAIQGSSNFTRRMAILEFEKKAQEYFNEKFNAKYLMIDLCDCRNDVFFFKNQDKETFVSDSISVEKTIAALNNSEIYRYSVFNISNSYWEESFKRFVELIKSKYEEENIIINKFRFAEEYLDVDGKIKDTEYRKYKDLYAKRGELISRLEEIITQMLPNAMVISPLLKPLGYASHRLGLSPMHYTDECYYIQNLKLERLFGMNDLTEEEISQVAEKMIYGDRNIGDI